MKLVAIVVLYQPKLEDLIRNILSYVNDVDLLLTYNNSIVCLDGFSELQPFRHKILQIGNGENVGIATALNAAVKWAEDNSYTHLLTLDQDSYFYNDHLTIFKQLIVDYQMDDIGVYAPNLDNRGNLCFNSNSKVLDVNDTITSGSIFPTKTFIKSKGFEDGLFIDAVDYEYCYRIKSLYGLRTVIFPEIHLIHEVGYPKRILFGFMTDNYSAMRTYFIIRNHIIIWNRYPKLFQKSYKITLIKLHILNRVFKIVIGEQNKIYKLKAVVMGIVHGFAKRKGYYKI
jgi:rhamnosyltransferase